MEIWVVRHGETEGNLMKIIQGQQPGKLSELGIAQAKLTGRALAKEKFHHAYVSDLGRTRETYEAMSSFFVSKKENSVTFTSLIREKSGGVLEGLPLSEWGKRAKESGLSIREYKAEEGESWQVVMQRAEDFLGYLIDTYVYQKPTNMLEIEKKFVIKRKTDSDGETISKTTIEEVKMSDTQSGVAGNSSTITKSTEKNSSEVEEKKAIEPSIGSTGISSGLGSGKAIQSKPKSITDLTTSKSKNHNGEIQSLTVAAKSLSLSKPQSKTTTTTVSKTEPVKKILVVSHGGFIMELFNAIGVRMKKQDPTFNNDAKNCSITVIKIALDKSGREDIKILRRNDVNHLKLK